MFEGVKKIKKCILTLSFTFSGQLGSLIISRHAFRWSWSFQKLIQVRYTLDVSISQVVKVMFPRLGVYKIASRTMCFFQFLMLKMSSIKELLHKPSEIQGSITGTLPGKLKRKSFWTLSYKILPPQITKTWEVSILGDILGTWEPM